MEKRGLNFCRIDEFMEAEILENYIKAGKAVAHVRERSREFIKDGMLLRDIVENIENMNPRAVVNRRSTPGAGFG